jgi:putative Holliday junction resolvase
MTNDQSLEPMGKLLAFDVGLARIGIAVCDPLRLAARPLGVLQRASRRQDFERLARLVDEQEAVGVVCGLPLNMDGSEGDQARTTRKWAMRLAHALRALLGRPVPIALWDERLSTFAAQSIIAEKGLQVGRAAGPSARTSGRRKGADEYEDAVAAAVILQSFLDADKRGGAVPAQRAPGAVRDLILLPPKDTGPAA